MMKWWGFGVICGIAFVALCFIIPFVISYIFTEFIPGVRRTLPFVPLCIKYKINPFNTTLSKICYILNTKEKREEWLSVVKNETQKGGWKNLFKQFPTEPTEEKLEELRKELNKKVEEF